jgi:phage terminase Nu1 subunit (DNA packaging protein)
MKLDDSATCTSTELAWLLGLTDRAIRLYRSKGLAVRAKRGRYLLGPSVRRIHHHVAETAAGRAGTSLADARAKLATLQAEGQQLRNASLRGEVVPKADVLDTWKAIMRGVRQMALSWPGKVAFELPTLTAADRAVLERIVHDDLEFAMPEQLGALATFLCSDAAAQLNGVAVPVDGGWLAR